MKNASEMTPAEALEIIQQATHHDGLALNRKSFVLIATAEKVLADFIEDNTKKPKSKKEDAPQAS